MYRQKYVSKHEIEQMLNDSSDEEETTTLVGNSNRTDFILLPPPKVDALSDNEEIDEDLQPLNDGAAIMPEEVAVEIEIMCEYDDDNPKRPFRVDDDDDAADISLFSKRKPIWKPRNCNVKWSKAKRFSLKREPVCIEHENIEDLYQKFGS